MDQQLSVDTAAVRMMAVGWRSCASELVTNAPPNLGLSCQATATAVSLGHSSIMVAGASLRDRVHTTATKASDANIHYLANDKSSAAQLRRSPQR